MVAFAHSPAPLPPLSERTTTDLLCTLEDDRALLDDPCRETVLASLVRCMLIRHVLYRRGVEGPDLHPMEERAAFGQLPQDLADVYQPALLASLPSVCSHADSLVEVA